MRHNVGTSLGSEGDYWARCTCGWSACFGNYQDAYCAAQEHEAGEDR